MIKIGIIGMGNVSWNVHLPVLLAREDIEVSWICDKFLKKKKVLTKKNIPIFTDIDDAINFKKCDIALLTIPFSERLKIFDKIKDSFNGIFFEKPFALTLDQHKYFLNNFKNYEATIGYQRRHMGTVKSIKNIINQNLFGPLKSVQIYFGDVHYKFDGFRSNKDISGGGLFFESGSHWIDTVLFTTLAKDIKNFSLRKKVNDGLDIECEGKFNITNIENHKFDCNFYMTILENTSNIIKYNFDNCSIDLSLFDNNSFLKISNDNNKDFIIKDNEFSNFPNNSLDVATSFWNEFIVSFKNKKNSILSIDNFVLTTKIIELFYDD
jgi:hypothetical protein